MGRMDGVMPSRQSRDDNAWSGPPLAVVQATCACNGRSRRGETAAARSVGGGKSRFGEHM